MSLWVLMLAMATVQPPALAAEAAGKGPELLDADDASLTTAAKVDLETRRYAAAIKAGNLAQVEQALRRLLGLERSSRHLNNLGLFLSDRGSFAEAGPLLADAVAAAPGDLKGFYRANVALNLRRQFLDGAAEAELDGALKDLADYRESLTGWRPSNLARSRTLVLIQRSRIQERRGRLEDALQSAQAAEVSARKALDSIPYRATDLERQQVANDLGNAFRRQLYVRMAMQDPTGAQLVLHGWMKVAQEHRLAPEIQAQAHQAAAAIALSAHGFGASERQALEAESIYQRLGYAPVHLARVTGVETLLAAYWAQGKLEQASQVFKALDEQAQADAAAVDRVRLPMLRGLVYLDTQRGVEASVLFAERARQLAQTAGTGSVQYAEAIGLQGAALWRSGQPQHRSTAQQLLGQATAILTSPENAGAPDGSGLRDQTRRIIIDAQVDCVSAMAPDRLVDLLGLVDWAASGTVQKAVAEAAVRMGAKSPAMGALIRAEQDARREIDALRKSLAGEDERALSLTKDVAPRVGQRVSELDAFVRSSQASIREAFPDYARLTQPRIPTRQDLASRLLPDEAALYVALRPNDALIWLVTADGQARVVRSPLTLTQARSLVTRVRSSLEVRRTMQAFDLDAARALHAALVAPLREPLKAVRQLVVISPGVLSTLPFSVLLEEGGGAQGASLQWLMHRFAISQAPSVGSWLSARTAPAAADDALPLMGWADPRFGPAGAPVAAAQKRNAQAMEALALPSVPMPVGAAGPWQLTALPETRDELLSIASALKADPGRDLFLGDRATRASVIAASQSGELARRRVVVFATHGLMAGELAGLDQPALAMAADDKDQGDPLQALLKLDDVLSLKLHADWVVMSACNTGAADGQMGEALSGLARGMFYAGARSLLLTHWAVESESAKRLTTATFKALAANPAYTKAQSLREAMRAVSQMPGYEHPAFWAPFAIVGDGGR